MLLWELKPVGKFLSQTPTITHFLVYHKNKIWKNCKIYLITGTNNQTKTNTTKQTSNETKNRKIESKAKSKTYKYTYNWQVFDDMQSDVLHDMLLILHIHTNTQRQFFFVLLVKKKRGGGGCNTNKRINPSAIIYNTEPILSCVTH